MDESAFTKHGFIDPRRIAKALLTDSNDVAWTLGLPSELFRHQDQVRRADIQQKLRDLLVVLHKLEPRLGSFLVAYAWIRSQPLPEIGGLCAMHLIREGNVSEVLCYIDAMSLGAVK